MRTETHPDGAVTRLYEAGDRVILKDYPDDWFAKTGDAGVVLGPEGHCAPIIDSLLVQTDKAKAGGYGHILVPPWQLTPEPTHEATDQRVD